MDAIIRECGAATQFGGFQHGRRGCSGPLFVVRDGSGAACGTAAESPAPLPPPLVAVVLDVVAFGKGSAEEAAAAASVAAALVAGVQAQADESFGEAHPVATVRSSATFPVMITQIPPGSPARNEFETGACLDWVAHLPLQPFQQQQLTATCGWSCRVQAVDGGCDRRWRHFHRKRCEDRRNPLGWAASSAPPRLCSRAWTCRSTPAAIGSGGCGLAYHRAASSDGISREPGGDGVGDVRRNHSLF